MYAAARSTRSWDDVTRDLKFRPSTRAEELYPRLDEQIAALSS